MAILMSQLFFFHIFSSFLYIFFCIFFTFFVFFFYIFFFIFFCIFLFTFFFYIFFFVHFFLFFKIFYIHFFSLPQNILSQVLQGRTRSCFRLMIKKHNKTNVKQNKNLFKQFYTFKVTGIQQRGQSWTPLLRNQSLRQATCIL